MSFPKYSITFLALFLLFSGGCNRGPAKPAGFPDIHPCRITILQGGTPLEGASIVLDRKTGGNIGWTIGGVTDSHGVAVIKTAVDFKGAPEGEYMVCVSKTELSPTDLAPYAPQDPIEYDKWERAMRTEKRITYRLIKPEFGDPKKTPHSITISKGKNEATFDVGDPIKEEIK